MPGLRGAEALALALVSASGFMLMAASAHFFVLFLGLEIGSISLYVLAGYVRESPRSDEAAVKYFLLGSFASALFRSTGWRSPTPAPAPSTSTRLRRRSTGRACGRLRCIGPAGGRARLQDHRRTVPFVGTRRLSGGASRVRRLHGGIAKVGGFAGLMLILLDAYQPVKDVWQGAVAGVAGVSVLVGTIFAIVQDDARRMLAYSGVAHAGFLLTGLVAGAEAVPNLWFYLVAYTMVLVAGFAVVAVVAATSGGDTSMRSLSGLSTRASPFLAAVLAVLLIALAGIPITSGFVAKFGVFAAAWGAGFEWLVLLGLVASVAAFFFYLRVIVVMYFTAPVQAEAPGTATARPEVPAQIRWLAVVVVTVTLVLGVIPGPLLELLADTAP